jgi:alkylated DNA nucleotide flippase Atl1
VSIDLAVAEVVASIPAGCVMTYGDIGRLIGAHPRQVGGSMARLSGVPFHRVIRSDGTPASCHGGIAPGLLAAEGVKMHGGRVAMAFMQSSPVSLRSMSSRSSDSAYPPSQYLPHSSIRVPS